MDATPLFRWKFCITTCILAGSFFLGSAQAEARIFNLHYVISDRDMTDAASLTAQQVQSLFERLQSTLATYVDTVQGVVKTAANIIVDSAATYQISPKYLITVLQKEQSLVTDPTPSERQYAWATGYGVCDSCSTDDPDIQEYRGFANQVSNAARQNRKYFDQPQNYRFQVGQTSSVDGTAVTPANQATANLYNYTPHIHGQELFWNIWNRWFVLKYPDGSLLRIKGEQGIWLIRDGKKSPFLSRAAFLSQYSYRKVVEVEKGELDSYERGLPIKFPNYSLLQTPEGGVYLLADGAKRPIVSREAFRKLGYNPEELTRATWNDLNAIPDGERITEETIYPSGILYQSKQTGGIYLIKDGLLHTVHSREIFRSQFGGRKPIAVAQSELDHYPKGDDVPFRDGEIITSPGTRSVFFVSDGQLRPIANAQVFNALGLKWANLIRTTDRAIAVHLLGEPLDIVNVE